ncbi:threonine dehydratase [Stanieria cyanosphaera PCC 7437]|uniref:L-threonine dehydratase catabolic TdcB n=1 Tax=Stanieria cyanosphaera (strain ATCC 29371 / PCC 7437) TaxID=111780 RepID=K9Y0A9_STAC7|nr:threonine ammonia-lyase [Stanieria cyanosphaera]AFZ37729.1 threonine dehydratase [Stanieria cyanosphaera PCC 7437]
MNIKLATFRPPNLENIRQAAKTILAQASDTPCRYSRHLSEMAKATVILKMENLQFTGSFKDRGALVKLLSLTAAQRKQGIIAMSAGNHAQAVAHQAQRLNIPAVIVMPCFTPNIKVERTRSFGAEVIFHGETLDDAIILGKQIAQEKNLNIVHPYDDEQIIAGQGTIALEMLTSHPDLEVLLIPVGGGGLIAGNAIAAKSLCPQIKIVGIQTQRFPSMLQALQGEPIICGSSTIAEGIAVKTPGKLTLSIIRELVDEILLVDEDEIEEAVRLLLEMEKTVVEGAGAAGLAALIKYSERFVGQKVGIILSGGNIDLPILAEIVQRSMVRSNQLVRLEVEIRDVPGALAEVARLIGETKANIIEVRHQREFSCLPLHSAELELVMMTRGVAHLQQIIEVLTKAGYKTRLQSICGTRGDRASTLKFD